MNRQSVKKVLLYERKFAHPKMTIDQITQVVFTAINHCQGIDDPSPLGENTVFEVLAKAGFKVSRLANGNVAVGKDNSQRPTGNIKIS